ncbi:response regulator [Mucilaginibacter sp.]
MKTIVLIEDNDDIRENTCELLELENYRVIVAANGADGLELVIKYQPDVVLCDVIMRGFNGQEVLRAVRSDRRVSAIPFMFLTSSAENEWKQGMQELPDFVLRKPFDPEELCTLLADLLK